MVRLILLLGAIAALVLGGGATASAGPPLLETILVPADAAGPVLSATSLDPDRVYQLQVSGTASDVDSLYCHVPSTCATPQLTRNLRVNGVGIDQFALRAGRLPYDPEHDYTVHRGNVAGQLSFTVASPVAGGAYTVFLWDVGPVGSKVTYSFSGYANVVRNRPRFQLGKTFMNGRGVLHGTIDGTGRTRNEPTHFPNNSMQTEVTSWSYTASAHGARKVLVLRVRVWASDDSVDCKVGTVGRITLVDDDRLLANGERRDSIVHSYPVADCPSFVQGVSNADAGHVQPRRGGRGGGQSANVTIAFAS